VRKADAEGKIPRHWEDAPTPCIFNASGRGNRLASGLLEHVPQCPVRHRARIITNTENTIMNQSTMTIHPWGSLAALRDLQREMSRLFEGGLSATRTARFPLVNLLSDSNEAIVTAEIPGVDPADLEISLTKGQLTIRGSVKDGAPEGEGVACHRKERGTGPFARTFALPFEVEEEKISAKYEKGVLAITLPRAEKSKPKTIPVISN
jgi:HSP20 family protein